MRACACICVCCFCNVFQCNLTSSENKYHKCEVRTGIRSCNLRHHHQAVESRMSQTTKTSSSPRSIVHLVTVMSVREHCCAIYRTHRKHLVCGLKAQSPRFWFISSGQLLNEYKLDSIIIDRPMKHGKLAHKDSRKNILEKLIEVQKYSKKTTHDTCLIRVENCVCTYIFFRKIMLLSSYHVVYDISYPL